MSEHQITRSNFLRGAAGLITGGVAGAALSRIVHGDVPTSPTSEQPDSKQIEDPRMAALEGIVVGDLSHEPEFERLRPVVELNEGDFTLERINNIAEYIKRAPQDLDRLIALIEKSEVDVNLSHLAWFQKAGNEPYLQPPTLLTILRNLKDNLSVGYVDLVVVPEDKLKEGENYFMGTITDYYVDGTTPHLEKSHIYFNEKLVNNSKSASLKEEGGDEQISNLDLLLMMVYEYTNRLNQVGDLVTLKKQVFFEKFPVKTPEEVRETMKLYHAAQMKAGLRHSESQNIAIFELHRAIAKACGDEKGKVVGLERSESWPQYKNYIAALHGDPAALMTINRLLIYGATY